MYTFWNTANSRFTYNVRNTFILGVALGSSSVRFMVVGFGFTYIVKK